MIQNQFLTPGNRFLSIGEGRTQYIPVGWNLTIIPYDRTRNGAFVTYDPNKGMGIGAAFIKSQTTLSQEVTLQPGNNWLNLEITSHVKLSPFDKNVNWGNVAAGWRVMFSEKGSTKMVRSKFVPVRREQGDQSMSLRV